MESSLASAIKNHVEVVTEANAIMKNTKPESTETIPETRKVAENKGQQSGNKHRLEIDYLCDNEDALMPLECRLQQPDAKLNEWLLENNELKNRNRVLEIQLDNITCQMNDVTSERDQLEEKVMRLQEERDEYCRAAQDAWLNYSTLQEKNEKEKKELEMALELSEINGARCKASFRQLQAALTAEHLRATVYAKEEHNARHELSHRDVKIRKLEAQNVCQKSRIAELEMELERKKSVPRMAQPGVGAGAKTILSVVPAKLKEQEDKSGKPLKHDSNLKMLKNKILTAVKPLINKLGAIYPRKISNGLKTPIRAKPTF
ncbi:Uncharacterized protein APZ42_016685 [Daphnia magna]|uniref:Uncharacterized protein n=1 Tax=Daphnia magna TaxID=35525 RepID=A0A165A2I2_9CRUS|nr:Uncharacterized protein APZ42_016685 [Daphnia magna]